MEEIFECDACHRRFKSAKSLTSHYRFCKVGTHVTKRQKKSKYKIVDGLYRCECGREFNNYQSLNAHFCWCMVHKRACGLKEEIAPRKHRAKAKCNFSKPIQVKKNLKHCTNVQEKSCPKILNPAKLFQYGKVSTIVKKLKEAKNCSC